MKNMTALTSSVLFGFILLTSIVDAGAISIGLNIYSNKIKDQCGDKTSGSFASAFSQNEWEEALITGKFESKVKEICPQLHTYNMQWTPYLFEFSYEYANDTGKEPTL